MLTISVCGQTSSTWYHTPYVAQVVHKSSMFLEQDKSRLTVKIPAPPWKTCARLRMRVRKWCRLHTRSIQYTMHHKTQIRPHPQHSNYQSGFLIHGIARHACVTNIIQPPTRGPSKLATPRKKAHHQLWKLGRTVPRSDHSSRSCS